MTTNYSPMRVKEVVNTLHIARQEYHNLRDQVMLDIVNYLKESGARMTARELSNKFGLSIQMITNLFYYRNYDIARDKRYIERRLAPLNEYNEPDLDHIKVERYQVIEYYYRKRECFRRW